MMYVQSQDRILNRMKEEDRKTWLIAFFAALGQPVVWAVVFVAAADRLNSFGYPFWGFLLWVVGLVGVSRWLWLMARTLTAAQEVINTEEASETIRSE
jgi:hypothetical protein